MANNRLFLGGKNEEEQGANSIFYIAYIRYTGGM